ncbi:MAG TPA: glycosyltransferase family 2 protein [Chitinophagaceae bacterium]|nr:glycosyltransferase family 2 protein [Chitinophagaceae bacterium]
MNRSDLPLVSIVTIVYNGEKHMEQTIQSVLNQSYPNIEYIIIDGGSTDDTLSIIKRYETRVAYWISERDNGIADAFNKGLKRASGSIIGLINSDDWYEPEAVEKVVKDINGSDIVYGDLKFWKNGKADFIIQGDHTHLEDEMTMNHPTVFVRKKVYDRFGLFNNDYRCAMDYELMLRFKINNCSFKHIPFVITNMRWDGISDTRWLLGCKETLSIKNKYLPGKRVSNQLYFYKHVLANAVPRMLGKLNLDFITRVYRSRFSKIKKSYE